MDYELDIKKTVRCLEQNIIARQQKIKALNEDLCGSEDCHLTREAHIEKIELIGAVEAMKKERYKLVEMLKN